MVNHRFGKFALGIAMAATMGATACGGDAAGSQDREPDHEIAVTGFGYQPERITVPRGAIVEWTNEDKILHTVTEGLPESAGNAFDGQLPGVGEQFTLQFDAPGVYQYFCTRHSFMTGTVTVTEERTSG